MHGVWFVSPWHSILMAFDEVRLLMRCGLIVGYVVLASEKRMMSLSSWSRQAMKAS